jgi:helix-turn-helix protein
MSAERVDMNEQRFLFQTPKLALTRVEAADALDISPATLDRLTQRGLLRPSRALRRPLFAVEELKRFLQETTAGIECSKRPDQTAEVLEFQRESEPHRQNDYDESEPLEAGHGR